MKKKTIFLGGAHRGGKAITDVALSLLPWREAYEGIIIADPKEDRARQLANDWQKGGIRSKGLKEPCEKAIQKIEADSIILAIDTVLPMSEILKKRLLPTQWQLLARGLGTNGPVIGMAGTLTNGDTEERTSSIKLINVLGSFIAPQSSSNATANPLNADSLYVMRKKVSGHSVRRLGVLDREPGDIRGGVMNFFWGMKTYPMIVQEKPESEKWREVKEQATQVELPMKLSDCSEFAVAAIGKKNVDFFIIESQKGRRIVKFYMPLVHTLPDKTTNTRNAITEGAIGAIASGLGLMAIAPLLVAAMVTD